VWEVFVGNQEKCSAPNESWKFQSSSNSQNSIEGLLRQYLVSSSMLRKDNSTNCEAASECSTADTNSSWTAFHADDVALAEQIAAVLMDRENVNLPGTADFSPSVVPS